MGYSFKTVIKNKLGIHARIAAALSKTVSQYNVEAYILYHGSRVNVQHLLDVIALSITENAEIEIDIEGKDAEICGKELQMLIENNFGE
ncbi:MAG: HPr family phosphocarrier protein [Candidatus Mucispirillum faecigallinarum]|nr:HPr family phosphocarrier protein [Candidatus Mucispirillum faecigallinarum]